MKTIERQRKYHELIKSSVDSTLIPGLAVRRCLIFYEQVKPHRARYLLSARANLLCRTTRGVLAVKVRAKASSSERSSVSPSETKWEETHNWLLFRLHGHGRLRTDSLSHPDCCLICAPHDRAVCVFMISNDYG
ncbi:hypothetical protein NPIL_620741 [Nephila pilipes]|uniref:Uncharacterized protein n=1 Tax=Nephila pilipes TaxID=299642 RepID=A0A8X6NSE6_NEPPI|nr:hypothetical protein NPIL_620741 [Nephila pilipes]